MVQKKTDFFEPAEVDVFRAGWTRSHAGRPPIFEKPSNEVPAIFYVEQQGNKPQGKEMTNLSISKIEFRLSVAGTLIGFLVIACGTTWTISNSMNEKIDKARIEINSNVQTAKTELATAMQNNKTDLTARLDKIETKFDADAKDTAQGLAKIQTMLENNKQTSK
ncbi:TPA: hypothetical protein QCI11_003306 [Enterobacter ludwigii]|jgi:hypothetical protein|uniref:hypothetical protein n=1 Tax=Enterobacter cloacae complex TaxID=354276 RepID=UPI0005CFA737|nr:MULTISPECIES: hypothetical protein [Enterobacter cloacae complex]EKS7197926.1 hypothetical protein [Enterobacter ludwigii]ELV2797436.1 hypothetical protein [Enterobacter ludwigii]MCM2488939.1 hypothetical protein [Enterobacter cloacae]MED5737016.1 hypothetical protein [Enterobacter ludwigii]RTN61074.1 hypothetical protein EKN82_08425 [Enterobacter ludwigii]